MLKNNANIPFFLLFDNYKNSNINMNVIGTSGIKQKENNKEKKRN